MRTRAKTKHINNARRRTATRAPRMQNLIQKFLKHFQFDYLDGRRRPLAAAATRGKSAHAARGRRADAIEAGAQPSASTRKKNRIYAQIFEIKFLACQLQVFY